MASTEGGVAEVPAEGVKAKAAALEAQLHTGNSSSSSANPSSGSEVGASDSKEKEKRKGKGKAPGPPPPPKAKAKANVERRSLGGLEAKVPTWKAITLLAHQRADGGFSTEAVAKALEEMAQSTQLQGVNFQEELSRAGPNAASLFVLSLLDLFEKRKSSSWSNAPGDEGDDELDERMEEACISMLASQKIVLTRGFLPDLRRYLAENAEEKEQRTAVEELRDKWVAFATKGSVKEIDEEAKKRKDEEQKAKEEASRRAKQQIMDFWAQQKPRSLENIDWGAAAKFLYCHGGSGGAFLVQFGATQEAVVVKPLGIKAVEEAIAVEVAKLLKVKVADQRVLGMSLMEFYHMAGAIYNIAEAMNEESATQAMVYFYQGNDGYGGKSQFAALVEFVSGHVLGGLPAQQALQGPNRWPIFHQLGRIIALDVVLNNLDRLPAIWDNEGNLGNVMINPAGEVAEVVGIDQQVNSIASPSDRQSYFQKVESYVSQAMHGRRQDPKVEDRLEAALFSNCGVKMEIGDLEELLSGSKEVFESIASLEEENLKEIFKRLAESMVAAFADPVNPHVGLARLDESLDFVLECMTVVASAVKRHPS